MTALGWSNFFQQSLEELGETKLRPARVIGQGRGLYQVQTDLQSIFEAAITSRFHDSIKESTEFPTVGDWIMFAEGEGNDQATIHSVLKRKSSVQRTRSGGQKGVQLIAANIDFMLIVSSCNEDFDIARLGRYVGLGKDSTFQTVLILTKADLSPTPEKYISEFRERYPAVEGMAISSLDQKSMECLQRFFAPGMTSVLLGSSGVGKSTLTNYLLGFESQKTQSLSSESKGRHTTTARYLRRTRWGGLVIDTPGMQEISVEPVASEQNKFSDVEELMLGCKFTNCQHKNEPGCAIQKAIKDGSLRAQRWDDFLSGGIHVLKKIKKTKKQKY